MHAREIKIEIEIQTEVEIEIERGIFSIVEREFEKLRCGEED